MKSFISLSIFLFYSAFMTAQIEKGLWLYSGSFEYGSIERDNLFRATQAEVANVKLELGKFVAPKQVIGAKLDFDMLLGKSLVQFNQQTTLRRDIALENSIFYRYYFVNLKKINLFAESSFSVLNIGKRDNNSGDFFIEGPQFANYSGAGVSWVFKNTAIEFSFNLPTFRSELYETRNRVFNFTLNRTLQRPDYQGLAKLEDTYLFVRNLYYGLSWRAIGPAESRKQTNALINIGFFLTNNWLLDIELSGERGFIFNKESFLRSKFSLENAFFIRLNENGWYLRPALTLELNEGFLRAPNNIFITENTFNVIGNLELVRFYGSRLILGGGTALRTMSGSEAIQPFLFLGTLRTVYFINSNVSIEAKISVPAYGFTKMNEDLGERNAHLLAFTQFKIRTFIFQE